MQWFIPLIPNLPQVGVNRCSIAKLSNPKFTLGDVSNLSFANYCEDDSWEAAWMSTSFDCRVEAHRLDRMPYLFTNPRIHSIWGWGSEGLFYFSGMVSKDRFLKQWEDADEGYLHKYSRFSVLLGRVLASIEFYFPQNSSWQIYATFISQSHQVDEYITHLFTEVSLFVFCPI